MLFMRYPIDVIFVDRAWRVVDLAEGLEPWVLARSGRGAEACLELPVGTVAASGTQVGDELVAEAVS